MGVVKGSAGNRELELRRDMCKMLQRATFVGARGEQWAVSPKRGREVRTDLQVG